MDLDALRGALAAQPNLRLAVLFGSTARGTAHPGSDVDLGVSGLDSPQQAALAISLERALGRRVDLVALDAAPALLRFEVAREGQVIVERVPHAWSDFRAKAMVDWWDWAPTARRFHEAAARRLRERVASGPA